MPSTFQSAMAWMSASMPICRKKTGTSRWPIGARSLRMRSAELVRASARPATNAPMIGARSARFANSANASVNANASTTSVPADRL